MSRRVVTVLVVLAVAWGGLASALALGATPKLGLDLQGGTSVILRAPDGTDQETLELAVELMRRRIEDFGNVQEPEISIQGDTAVLVDLPGVTDQERALDAIGQTGQLSFRPVLDVGVAGVSPLLVDRLQSDIAAAADEPEAEAEPADDAAGDDTAVTSITSTSSTTTTTTTTLPLPAGVNPDTGITESDDVNREAWLATTAPDGTVLQVYHVGPAFLLGTDVADSQAVFASQGTQTGFGQSGGFGEWIVTLDFTSEGENRFAEATRLLASFPVGDPRRQLAIVLDGEVVSAPPVSHEVDPQTGITGGSASITLGTGDQEQRASDLAVVLRYGSLPVTFERDQVQKVSATLGEDSLRAGLVAGIGGLLLVLIVMLLYYRSLALVTVVGLTVFGSLVVAVFALLGAFQGVTLTLAGVAGVIVAIGITADSYIVYFERIKDEVRKGRNVRAAVDEGFKKAFRTIVTADTVSILGATLLWLLAVGPVKGFALALGIATVIDIIVAYFFTRPSVAWLASGRLGETGAFSIRSASGAPIEATA